MATKKKKATKKAATKAVVTKAPKKKVAKKAAGKKKVAAPKSRSKAPAKKALAKKAPSTLTKAESKENLRQLIGRAILDRKFRGLITRSPEKALAAYPLLPDDQRAVMQATKDPLAAAQSIDRLIDDTVGPVGAI